MRSLFAAAAVLAVATPVLTPAATDAATIENTAGSRGVTIASVGGIGQSFTAVDTSLTSIGFYFSALNPSAANDPITLTLRAGESLTGAVIASAVGTLPGTIANRTPVLYEFAFSGTPLTVGDVYTAVLTTGSVRNAVSYGPRSSNTATALGPDAYLGGRLLSGTDPDPYGFCGKSGQCDLNFRIVGTTATPAVPEPAAWAMMLGGFGLLGGALRRRRAPLTFA